MKKRLRKKLMVGEFKELDFALTGNLIEMDEETEVAFFERFFDLCEEFDFGLDGAFGQDSFDLAVLTGVIGTQNEERRAAFLEKLKDFKEITGFDASNLI